MHNVKTISIITSTLCTHIIIYIVTTNQAFSTDPVGPKGSLTSTHRWASCFNTFGNPGPDKVKIIQTLTVNRLFSFTQKGQNSKGKRGFTHSRGLSL